MMVNLVILLFEVGGFIGLLVVGWGLDKWFCGNCGLMNLIFVIGIFFFVVLLWIMSGVSYVL